MTIYDPSLFGFQSLKNFGGHSGEMIPTLFGEGPDMFRNGGGVLSTTMNATNFACMMIGRIMTSDRLSHTIDTTGSSKISLRIGAATWASGTSTAKVGIAPADLTTGPAARASITSSLINFDVACALTGGAGITANAMNDFVPTTGTKAIAHGDLVAVCMQMTVRGGADSVVVSTLQSNVNNQFPTVSQENGAGTIAATNGLPNMVITFSDGTRGYFEGGCVFTTPATSASYSDNTTVRNELANWFKFPFPVRVSGICFSGNGTTQDNIFSIYRNPLNAGTLNQLATVTSDLNVRASTGSGRERQYFLTPFDFRANEEFAIGVSTLSASSNNVNYWSVSSTNHWEQSMAAAMCYAVTRDQRAAGTAFAQQNSGLDRFFMAPIIAAAARGSFGGVL